MNVNFFADGAPVGRSSLPAPGGFTAAGAAPAYPDGAPAVAAGPAGSPAAEGLPFDDLSNLPGAGGNGNGNGLPPHNPNPGWFRRVLLAEGPRGMSMRTTVLLRHTAYVLTVFVTSALCQMWMRAVDIHHAGEYLLSTSAAMVAVAMVASWVYPDFRRKIIDSLREVLPGMLGVAFAIAALAQLTQGFYNGADSATFGGPIRLGLTWAYGITLFGGAAVLFGTVWKQRSLNRSRGDDEEVVRTWARQDHLQR